MLRHFQFRLRTILLITTLVAVGGGLYLGTKQMLLWREEARRNELDEQFRERVRYAEVIICPELSPRSLADRNAYLEQEIKKREASFRGN